MLPIFYRLLLLAGLFAADVLWTGVAAAQVYEESGEKKHSWFSFSRPAKKNPADQMDYARELLKERKLKKATKAFRSLVITWPSAPEAAMAQWAYARLLDKRGKKEDAFDAYQVLLEKYAGRFPDYDRVLQRQFEIAKEVMNKRRAQWMFGGFEAPERAIPLFEAVIRNGPRSPMAPEAQYLAGTAHEKNFDYELAVLAYSTVIHRYPASDFVELASFARARSLFNMSKNYPNDTRAIEEAWAGVLAFMRAYPASEFTAEARAMRDELLTRRAKYIYEIARHYDRVARRPQVALESYREFVQLYPQSPQSDDARERIRELSAMVEQTKDDDEENE
jgi:outer membrane protein assembly factor BamD